MSPRIGITCRTIPDGTSSSISIGVREPYIHSVTHHGGIPILIPTLQDPNIVSDILPEFDGFLLPGGEDVSPSLYNEEPHPLLGAVDSLRDQLEVLVVRYAREHRVPLLGICRGCQVMNVACGGSLYQDLSTQKSEAPEHRRSGYDEISEAITVSPTSGLAAILGTTGIEANSLHHQAVKVAGQELSVVATAADGVVEAIELPGHPFFIGIQCHPETLWQSLEPRWSNLFNSFIAECSRYKSSR